MLEKALYLPEDEQMNKEFMDKRYPDMKDQLFVNPFPAVKKGGKKKKKKKWVNLFELTDSIKWGFGVLGCPPPA